MINNLNCYSTNTLLEAIHIINENTKGACFVIDQNNRLTGVVTDGDIRRSILNSVSLDSSISEIVSSNFVFGTESDSYEDLYSKLDEKVRIIPIINKDGKVVDYLQFPQSIHFPVASPVLSGNEFKYLIDAFCRLVLNTKLEFCLAFLLRLITGPLKINDPLSIWASYILFIIQLLISISCSLVGYNSSSA